MNLLSLSKTPLILPGASWLALPIVLALAARRRGFFRIWGCAFGSLIAIDAWLNGSLSPLAEGSAAAVACGVVFVILGDARVFLAAEYDGSRASVLRAAGLALVVPILSQLSRWTFPAIAATPRLTYLTYELLFLGVLAVWYFAHARRRSGARRAFVTRIAGLAGIQYALWSTVDVIVLTAAPSSAEVALALRIVPDLIYYVAFVPWVLAGVPREAVR